MNWIFGTLDEVLARLNAAADARWGPGVRECYESEEDLSRRVSFEAQARYEAGRAGRRSKGMTVDRDETHCNGLWRE
jgi:hypothetical protein